MARRIESLSTNDLNKWVGIFMSRRSINFLMIACGMILPTISGCAHHPPPGVPQDAILVARETGRMAFASAEEGIVFIYDSDDKKMAFTTPVHVNDKILFYPERNQILLNGRVMSEMPMNPNHLYQLYFAKE